MQGVYSKLQTMEIFAKYPYNQERVLLMGAGMYVRCNTDEVFGTVPPAAVTRGEADTCMYERRPRSTYFHRDAKK